MDIHRYHDYKQKLECKQSRWVEKRALWRDGGLGMVGGLIIVVVVGFALLLDSMGIVNALDLWRFWPLGIVVVGIGRLLECRQPATRVWGGIITLIGLLLFITSSIHLFAFDFAMLWWAMSISAFGVSMLLRSIKRNRTRAGVEGDRSVGTPTINLWRIFGGGRWRFNTSDFRGGKFFALFGGLQVDLRGSRIERDNVSISINALFGGVELIVPENWIVTVNGVSVLGAFIDRTLLPRPIEDAKVYHLVVTGTAMFAGVNIRN
jgi:predicted membrane protein